LTSVFFYHKITTVNISCFWDIIMNLIKPNINVDYAKNATIATITEEKILEEKDIRELQESVFSIIEQAGQINLILDFRNVKFLSSSVLGLLIRISKKVYEKNGQLRLCNINKKINEIFKITRLNRIFDIYPDLERATEAMVSLD